MLGWAYEALGQRDDDLLELYCGNGNFTPAPGHPGTQGAGHRDQQVLGQCGAGQPGRQRGGQRQPGAPVGRRADPGAERGSPVPPPGRHRPEELRLRQCLRRSATSRHGSGHLRADPALRAHPVHFVQPGNPGAEHRSTARHAPDQPLRCSTSSPPTTWKAASCSNAAERVAAPHGAAMPQSRTGRRRARCNPSVVTSAP